MDTIKLASTASKVSSNNWQKYLIESTLFAKENLKRTDDWCICNLVKETNCSIEKAKELFNNIIKYNRL